MTLEDFNDAVQTGFRLEETDIEKGATLKYVEWAGAFFYARSEGSREQAIGLRYRNPDFSSDPRHKGIDHSVVVEEGLSDLINDSILGHDYVKTYEYSHLDSEYQQALKAKARSSFEEAVREKLTFMLSALDRQFESACRFVHFSPSEEKEGKVIAIEDEENAREVINQYKAEGRAKIITTEQVARKIHRSKQPRGRFGSEEITFWPEWHSQGTEAKAETRER
jgi:uncharacterized FlaG/YvyC family protein